MTRDKSLRLGVALATVLGVMNAIPMADLRAQDCFKYCGCGEFLDGGVRPGCGPPNCWWAECSESKFSCGGDPFNDQCGMQLGCPC